MDPENRSDEDDSGLLQPEDSLDDRGVGDVLDEGWSPPERPWASTGWGTTAREEAGDEPLDARLARELPDGEEWLGDDLGDATDTDGELLDDEVGDVRRRGGAARGGRRDRRGCGVGGGGRGAHRVRGAPALRLVRPCRGAYRHRHE